MNNLFFSKLIEYDLITKEDINIYKYSIFVLLFNLSSVLITLCIGLFLNEFQFCAYTLLLYIPIRMSLGGYHCKKPQTCFIFFECFYIVMIYLYKIGIIIEFMIIIEIIFLMIFLYDLILKDKKVKKIILLLVYYFLQFLFPSLKIYFIYSILMNEILYLLDIVLKEKKQNMF